jgi:hypothetical protein
MDFTRNNYPHFHPVAMATAFTLSIVSPSVWADTCTQDSSLIVNITGEDSSCDDQISLREAIIYANAIQSQSGTDTVTFASALNGSTIVTNNTPIDVTDDIIIDGMITGGMATAAEPVLITLKAPTSGALFNIASANSVGIDFDLKNVTLEQVSATDHIINMSGYGDVVLDNIHTTDATSGYGIFSGDVDGNVNVTLKNSRISGSTFDKSIIDVDLSYSDANVNIAIETSTISPAQAGALVNTDSYDSGSISNITISIDKTDIDGGVWGGKGGIIHADNEGGKGGKGSRASVVFVSESSIKNVVSNNSPIVYARGADGDINITDSEITGNNEGLGDTTAVAVNALGVDVTILNSHIADNGSAAIAISSSSSRADTSLSVKNTSITGNITSQPGSAISADATYGDMTLTVSNSTMSGNQTIYKVQAKRVQSKLQASVDSGAILVSTNSTSGAIFNLENSTISNNSTVGYGGGIGLAGFTDFITANINNSIVAGNTSASGSDNDLLGTFNVDYSLIGDTTTQSGTTITGDNNILDQDPMLQELTLNGGAWVHQLKVSSPAIAAGNGETADLPDFDQRGEGFARLRNIDSNPELDMGAVQYFAGPVVVSDVFSVELNSENNLLNVLSNDAENSNGSALDPASVTIMEHPENGSADTEGDGVITYTPNADFEGDDILRYVVRDITGNYSLEATVTITVAEDSVEELVAKKSKSGGAFHFWLLSLLGVFGLRRKS